MDTTNETATTNETVNPYNLDALLKALLEKTIGVLTIVDNLKPCSFQYINDAIHQPVAGAVYDPSAINVDALVKVLTKKGVDTASDFMRNWKLPERKVNTFKASEWAVGDFLKAPKASGKQSAECVYRVEWKNDTHILIVPFANMSKDTDGIVNATPRSMTHTALSTLEPVKYIAN